MTQREFDAHIDAIILMAHIDPELAHEMAKKLFLEINAEHEKIQYDAEAE
jgi:hypothetical protein